MLNAEVLRQCCESQSVDDVLLESVFFGRYCEDVLLEYAVMGVTRVKMLGGRQCCQGDVVRVSPLMVLL